MIDIEELKRLEAVATEGRWELHTSNECYTTEIVQVGYEPNTEHIKELLSNYPQFPKDGEK